MIVAGIGQLRFVELGADINFRLKPSQNFWLNKHRFKPEEANQSVLNRQLRRLAAAIVSGSAPADFATDAPGTKDHKFRFRPELALEYFIQQQREALNLENDGSTMVYLVCWSNRLPIVAPMLNAQEAHQFLLETFGAETGEIPIKTALLKLYDRCEVGDAKQWLWELKEAGKIRLKIPQKEQVEGGVVKLPDGNGKSYFYLEL